MQLPTTFGKYELLERIATGGMAEIYLARTFGVAGFEKRLVIKRIRPELAGDPHHVSLFINEARIGVQLNHENIVQLYDLGKVGRDWYIAMEHLHGRDLNKLVKALRARGERLPLPVAVHTVAEVCRGLGYAHALHDGAGQPLGLVHRDISPHNVLLTFAGGIKLVDFGIARLVGVKAPVPALLHKSTSPKRPGGGKYAYMSPEQACGHDVDLRTDVFSAGIVLWELLVGHRMYQHDDPSEKLRLVQQAIRPDPADEGIALDPGLRAMLDRALAHDPDERYASALLFEEDLRAWLYEHGEVDPRRDLTALLQRCFPDDAEPRTHGHGLDRMLDDIERLGASDATPDPTPPAARRAEHLPSSTEERKRVVAVFVDIDGMTSLSQQLEPEELFRRRYRALRWIYRVVEQLTGHVQRVVDDQVLVLFGVPRTRSDDLSRALECALELQRSVGALHERGLDLSLAIGIHAGDVTVDLSRRQPRYVARGDTTRLARRLAAYADHGDILITQRVLDGTQHSFRVRTGPSVPQRGDQRATRTFRVEGRRQGLRAGSSGPWLRRGEELDVLRRALTDLQDGRGTVVTLTGEIGSGKSRLARELRDLALRRGVAVHLGAARPWAEPPPLEILRDLLLDILGLDRDAPRDRLIEASDRLPQLGLGPGEVRVLQGLVRAGESAASETEILRAMERTIEGLARDRAIILILEDLHHLTEREQRSLARLLDRLGDLAVLSLLTHTGAPPTALARLGQCVSLPRFGQAQIERLLRALLGVEHLDPAIVDLAHRGCEGNPLYVEEMVKYLVQRGHISHDGDRASLAAPPTGVALPDSIAGLIAARIDVLEPAAKGALQLAGVIGQTFPLILLATAMGLDDPAPIVDELRLHGLIQQMPSDSGETWTFASELVREAALRSTLGVQRRTYHRLISEAMEHVYGDSLQPHLEALARHCAEAGRTIDAAQYVFRAGKELEEAQILHRAREIYERGLRYLQPTPDTPETWDGRVQGEAMLCYRSGAISRLLGEDRRAERSLQLALDISSDAGLPWTEARVHLELCRLYLTRGQGDLATAHSEQAQALATIEGESTLRRECLEVAASLAYEQGDDTRAESLWTRALALAGDDDRAVARCQLGMASRRIRDGDLEVAAELLQRALQSAQRSGDRILVGRVLNNLGLLHYWSQRLDDALSAFREALQVREGIGYSAGIVINQHNIGDVHLSRGDLARAWVAFARSRELAEHMGWRRGIALNDVYLGYIQATRHGLDTGLPIVQRAIRVAEELDDPEIAANGALIAARLLHEAGRTEEAVALLDDAREHADHRGMRVLLDSLDAFAAELRGAPVSEPEG